jgi:hypothetical protein
MRASGGPALEGAPAAGGVYHASQMRSSLFHPFLRLDARTGSLRLPATICSPNFRDRTLEVAAADPVYRERRRVRDQHDGHHSSLQRIAHDEVRRPHQ